MTSTTAIHNNLNNDEEGPLLMEEEESSMNYINQDASSLEYDDFKDRGCYSRRSD